ncbi:MAG TPA: hypothetical protein DDZ80_10460 [Cyanobacteria bacterium UBA8803]|nr:hypothetical protein [Cyanobacteria bacterium UBA9273]HBL58913.1 hypothetical protein [Cyanobacteria bacterium UBA8803]
MTPTKTEPKPFTEKLKQLKAPWFKSESLLIGGVLFAIAGLILTQYETAPPTERAPNPSVFCQEIVQTKATVSREKLAQLLTIPERDRRGKVQEILKEPYCRMSSLNIRAGATTEREAYPLAFDPQTWLVILYEGDTYVGYGFKRA